MFEDIESFLFIKRGQNGVKLWNFGLESKIHPKLSKIGPIAVLVAENIIPYISLNVEWELDKESFYKGNHIYYPLNK